MDDAVPSLFVVSLPRSLSTIVYVAAREALGLEEPRWTEAGELLNVERTPFVPWDRLVETVKFTPADSSRRATQLHAFLDDVVAPAGRAYKDVVQPFIVAQWLRARGMRVLYVRRPVAEVAWSMRQHGWWYPAQAVPPGDATLEGLVIGLARAASALAGIDAVTVDYADLLRSEDALAEALASLYPGRELRRPRYVDERFRARQSQVAQRLDSAEGRAFADDVAAIIARAAAESRG